MEALKFIGTILGLFVGFALIAGVIAAVSVAGFFLGWFLLAFFVIAAIFYGMHSWLRGR